MKILITGGAGFVGSHFAAYLLKKKHSVTILDNLSNGSRSQIQDCFSHSGFKFIRGDLFQGKVLKRAMQGAGRVFHFATNSDLQLSAKDPGVDLRQNILATFQVLEEMRRQKIRSVVYFSGSGVYGDKPGSHSETKTLLAPVSMYGATKLSCEAMLLAYQDLYGFKPLIFRPGNIVGGAMTHGVIHDLCRKIKKNPRRLTVLGNGRQDKSYIHIEDVITAVMKCASRRPEAYPVWNLSSGTNTRLNFIVNAVVRAAEVPDARIEYGRSAQGWPGDIPVYRLDIRRLKRTGWKPRYNSNQAVLDAVQSTWNEIKNA